MVRVRESLAVAEIAAALADAGGLPLAAEPRVASLVLGASAPGEPPAVELIR